MLQDDWEVAELLEGLIEAINSVPGASATVDAHEVESAGSRVDAVIKGLVGGQTFRLIVDAKREAYPRDVREAMWQLSHVKAQYQQEKDEIIPFFVARTISTGARELLKNAGFGYYDGSGSLFLPANAMYVLLDRPPVKISKSDVVIFQGQKARVLHALFSELDSWHSVKDLAYHLEISPATVSATLGELERREWAEVRGAGPAKERRLVNVREMVDAWAKYAGEQKPPKLTRYYVPRVDSVEALQVAVERACDNAGAAYAVTGEAAAQDLAPYLTTIGELYCRIEPGRKQADALAEIGARQVRDGWNLALIETRTRQDVLVGGYHAKVDANAAIALAPTLQIYLDLLQGPGRSKEMAQHLRSEILKI